VFGVVSVLLGLGAEAWARQGGMVTVPRDVVAYPSLVAYNGRIYTMDDTGVNTNPGTILSAIAVRDRKIMALGDDQKILALAGPDTVRIDLKGRAVLPGIVDPHTHIHDSALSRYINQNPEEARKIVAVFNADGTTIEEVKRNVQVILTERLSSVEKGKWVFINMPGDESGSGTGIGTQFVYNRATNIRELDKLAPEHPVLLSAHPAYMINTAAKKALKDLYGFEPGDEVDETGWAAQGVYYRRGVVVDGALNGRTEDLAKINLDGLQRWSSMGVTTFSSHIMGFENFDAFAKLTREGRMPVRFAYTHFQGFLVNPHAGNFYRRMGDMAGLGNDYLWNGGVGIGSVDSGIPSICTSLKLPEEIKKTEICRIAPGLAQREGTYEAVAAGARVAVGHVYGDLAADHFMDILDEAIKKAPGITIEHIRSKRMTMDHCGLYPRPDQIPRIKHFGIMLSCGANMMDRTYPWLKVYGEDKAKWIAPIKSILDGGVKVVWEYEGSPEDGIFGSMVPFITRKNETGNIVAADEAVDRVIVMKMATSWPAEFVLREDAIGTLKAGKLADFIVLNKDYFKVPIEEIHTIIPQMTVLGGDVVFLRNEFAAELQRPPAGIQLKYRFEQ
jgi:predicted amidohydrolase YtcJ